jgi:hypothetical protein
MEMSFYLKTLLFFLLYSNPSLTIYASGDLENPPLAIALLDAPITVFPLEEVVITARLATPRVRTFPPIRDERIVDGERIPTIDEFRKFITQGKIKQVKKFLLFLPLNIQDEFGNSFLHLAVSSREIEIINHLLKKEIKTNLKTFGLRQETALERAERFQFRDVVKILKRHLSRKKGISQEYMIARDSNPFFCNPLEAKVLPSIGH